MFGFDHVINVAPTGSHVGIGESLAVFLNQLGTQGVRVFSLSQFATIKDVDSSLWPHHGYLGGGPSQIDVPPDMLTGHDVICTAVGLAGDNSDFWDGGFAISVE